MHICISKSIGGLQLFPEDLKDKAQQPCLCTEVVEGNEKSFVLYPSVTSSENVLLNSKVAYSIFTTV